MDVVERPSVQEYKFSEVYRRSGQSPKSTTYLKRIYLVRDEPKFVRLQQHFWATQTSYYLYIILLGNGADGIPMTFRFALDVAGGFYILQLIIFNFILFMPIMYMEMFLGKYTHMANSQMYRMAPIFFGFSVLTFIISYFYCPMRAADVSVFLIGALRLLMNTNPLEQCEADQPGCFDKRDIGKDTANCTYNYMGFECGNKTMRYTAAYLYWIQYRNIDGGYHLWPVVIANVITWIFILFLYVLGMKLLGIFLKSTFCLNIIIYTVIFIMAVGTPGSSKGLVNLIEFRLNNFMEFITEVPMVAFFVTLRMGLICPSGYMTYGAFTNYKSKLNPGTECIALSITNIILNIYYLMVMHGVSGALGVILELEPNLVYVPHTGIYYAMIPQFLVYRKCPIPFIVLYHLSNWLLEIVRLAIALHMIAMNLYDFFPDLASYKTYVRMAAAGICVPVSIIMSLEMFAKVYMPLFEMVTIYFLQGFLLMIEGVMVFYCYGVSRLNDDIHFVTGRRPIKFWRIMWYCYPILINLFLFSTVLANLQNKIQKLPISKDAPNVPLFEYITYIGFAIATIYLIIIFVSTFFFIVVGIRKSKTIMNLLKPQFFWGPTEKKSRAARKAFTPRTSIRSQPPMEVKQRFRPRSIKQMREKDIAEHVTRGRVLLDFMFFSNVGKTETRTSGEFKQRDKQQDK